MRPIGLFTSFRNWIFGPPEPARDETRTQYKNESLTPFEEEIFRTGACPDCGIKNLAEGPHGGLSINYYCCNVECGSRFNDMTSFGVERITDAHPVKVVQAKNGY